MLQYVGHDGGKTDPSKRCCVQSGSLDEQCERPMGCKVPYPIGRYCTYVILDQFCSMDD